MNLTFSSYRGDSLKYCIFSDVHGNLEALETFLEEIAREQYSKLIFLGDAIGYGPNPNECLELIRRHADIILLGNHDHAAISDADISNFNHYARNAILWTRDQLTEDNINFIKTLTHEAVIGKATFVHATPCQPDRWHYLFTTQEAQVNFRCFNTQICIVGHSHQPLSIIRKSQNHDLSVILDQMIKIEEDSRYIINDGSIGQPRDGNPASCFVVYDAEEDVIYFRRLEYDYTKTQAKMRALNLPDYLIERLGLGR